MLFKLENIGLSFAEKKIFESMNFIFNKGDKIGLIGNNGTGKTSLFNIIKNKMDYSGNIIFDSKNFGYLDLKPNNYYEKIKELEYKLFETNNLSEKDYIELLDEYEKLVYNTSDIKKSLFKEFNLSLNKFNSKNIKKISGGEEMKIKLIKIFSQKYDYLLLDEPSNHLDSITKKFLIKNLNKLESFIVISHDPEVLNECCNKIIKIKDGKIIEFFGNYKYYEKEIKKEIELSIHKNKVSKKKISFVKSGIESRNQREKTKIKKIKKIEKKRSFNTSDMTAIMRFQKNSLDELRKKNSLIKKRQLLQLSKINIDNIKSEENIKINYLDFRLPSNIVLETRELQKKFENFNLKIKNFTIENNTKLALLGNNGTGKTTLIKLILGELSPSNGKVIFGNNIKLGYISQRNDLLNEKNTILEELSELKKNIDESIIKKYLGGFLFKKNDISKKINKLSEGEKVRLSVLRLILDKCNFLVLDEPSNHMDIKSKDILSSALKDFPGPIIVASHDSYFLKKFINKSIRFN